MFRTKSTTMLKVLGLVFAVVVISINEDTIPFRRRTSFSDVPKVSGQATRGRCLHSLGDCPDGYEGHVDYCYKLLPVNASWGEANHYCEAVGGRLAIIRSKAENDFVKNYLNRNHGSIKTSQIWIGGTDLLQEGIFVIPKTLELMQFFDWGTGQPDNNNGEHCLALFNSPPSFLWDDFWCEQAIHPLCQRPKHTDTEIVG